MANELRLIFERAKEAVTVRLDPSKGSTTAAAPFGVALSEDEYEDLRWYLEEYMDLPDAGSVVRARRIEEELRTWGRALYDALFREADHRDLLRALLDGDTPQLLTIATDDSDVLRLPWELIADRQGPLSRKGVTVRRQLERTSEAPGYRVELPLRLLIVVSRPADLGWIDPRLTTPAMLDALETLGEQVAIDFCRPPTLARMEEMLAGAKDRGEPYRVVHFEGHGTYLQEIGLGALAFERKDGKAAETDYVRADRLGLILAAQGIPLVILEACRSSMTGKVPAFRSVAPRLVDAGVGGVLAMSHAVHVEATRVLLDRFYREVVGGKSVGQALEAGRGALIASPHRWIEPGPRGKTVELQDWFLPTLYQQGEDLSLLPVGAAERLAETWAATVAPTGDGARFDVFLSHQHADSDRVEKLAREFRDRHGLRVWLDKWEIPHGVIHERVREGIEGSRFLLLVVSCQTLDSKWVKAEQDIARAIDPRGQNIIPLLLEDVELPPELQALRWYDLSDAGHDRERVAEIAEAVGPRAVAAEQVVGSRRQPPAKGEQGAFPRPPLYHFHGRARELYQLERELRGHRAVLLHAMGGMGKTTLAREAAYWWTRTGLFPDGACFLSFEQGAGADQVALVLGTYLEGTAFESVPADEQLKRARELFEERRVLMVWDNFESVLPAFQQDGAALYSEEERGRIVDLFRDWTESANGEGRLIVTCRPKQAGLPGARRMELHGLARPDSLHLLARVLEVNGLDLDDPRLDRHELEELLGALGDHPLSIELVAPHLETMTPAQIAGDFATLLDTFRGEAEVERNQSLLASLEFSTRRLGEAAQTALPWLGLFRGGVFEQVLLDVSELEPAAWEAARQDLEATALVRVEREILYGKRPYLRFHPTLAYRAASAAPASDEVRQRFVAVYLGVMSAVDQADFGANPRGGMELMAREEANYRAAVAWALEAEAYAEASNLGRTFRGYLERSGRLRERDSWVAWLAGEVGKGGFTNAAATQEQDAAWSLFTQGHAQEAVARLQALLKRLRAQHGFDAVFQLALTQARLGRVYYSAGSAEQAVPVLREAVAQWEQLVEREKAKGGEASAQRGNLAMTLGDLANALRNAGRLNEALEAGDRALSILTKLGHNREIAAGLAIVASILMRQGRFQKADERYQEALEAARLAGDRELEAGALQNRGILVEDRGRYSKAVELYQQALKLFQAMNSEGAVMRTCNLLGVAERKAGRLAEARAWYERSREIAEHLGDQKALAVAAQNLGIVSQQEGVAARKGGNEAAARRRFEDAAASVRQSLRQWERVGDEPHAADSHGQLARIHLLLGDLDPAEDHAHQAREIRERLGLKEAWKDYDTLADIARARGDDAGAANWERKRDELIAELERRAGGADGLPPQAVQQIVALAAACARAGLEGADLPPQAEAALAQFDEAPPPFGALAPFLRSLAAGDAVSVPGGLPPELGQGLEQLLAAVAEAKGG